MAPHPVNLTPCAMSSSYVTATTSIKVGDYFNLDQFITGLHEQCINESNFLVEEHGTVPNPVDPEFGDIVDFNFEDYLEHDAKENVLIVSLDTGETNSCCDAFDWLIDQALTRSTLNYAKVDWVTEDCKNGNSCHIEIRTSDGESLDVEDLIRAYFKDK